VGNNNILRSLAKQMLMHLVSKQNSTLVLPRHTLPLRMIHCTTLTKKKALQYVIKLLLCK